MMVLASYLYNTFWIDFDILKKIHIYTHTNVWRDKIDTLGERKDRFIGYQRKEMEIDIHR